MLHSLTTPREDWVICFVGLGAGGWRGCSRKDPRQDQLLSPSCPPPSTPITLFHKPGQGRVPVLFPAVSTAPIND